MSDRAVSLDIAAGGDGRRAAATDGSTRLSVSSVTVAYNNGHVALHDASFTLGGGTICGLVGVNGSGKSTLFKAIMGFVSPTRGSVTIGGQPVRAAHKRNLVAYVPQAEDVDWNFPVSVWDVVLMGRYGYMNFLRIPRKVDKEIAAESLRRVNMLEYRDRQIGELSGGQKKRVFLARALAQRGRIMLLDEPFTGVDVKTEAAIIDLLRELREEGHMVLVSTHDLGSVPSFCDRVVIINRTVLAAGPTDTTFTQANLTRAFGGALRDLRLDHTDAPGGGRNEYRVLSDDEEPLVFDNEGRLVDHHHPNIGGGCVMAEYLLQPFQYEYMLKAILVSGVIGGVCGLLSCFVTLKGWSLMGDALAHAIVPGVAITYLIGLPFALGAFASGLLAAVVMGVMKSRTPIREDATIGVVFTTFFAAGVLLISLFPSNISLKTIVFGNILGIADGDIVQMIAISAVTLGVIAAKWKDLLLFAFDPNQARAIGLNPTLLHLTLLTLLAATAVAALQAVGACLVVAMLVTPGATAYLLTDRFGRMMGLASVMGVLTSVAGAYGSYFLDGSTGGCIVCLQTAVFLLALVFAPKHGTLASRRRARRTTDALLATGDAAPALPA